MANIEAAIQEYREAAYELSLEREYPAPEIDGI
jgi:hypothetical protein